MYTTKNDLPAMTRADVIVILNARLADSIDLMQQAKQAHWNVKGPSFIALHKAPCGRTLRMSALSSGASPLHG
jgi:starvation-inducible DNA-binding protein